MGGQRAVRACVIRGGTSKGLYFHADDLPVDAETRNMVVLGAMGAPDPREIDGMGGGHPLTSKVAIVKASTRQDADVDYLFLQVWPDRAEVSDSQNCGNLLAGVGPFAIEEGLVAVTGDVTPVRVWMENTKSLAVVRVVTPNGRVEYEGAAHIDGVPGSHAPTMIDFLNIAGSSCGALLPTGNPVDVIEGYRVTCVDNGMPVVCVAARDLGLNGYEQPDEIEANAEVCNLVERIRRLAGSMMHLGDVTSATVPKVSLLAPPRSGGQISTRTFIPKRVHDSIGVFGAVSVATACLVPGSVANDITAISGPSGTYSLDVEHPTGHFTVEMQIERIAGDIVVQRSAILRTARLLMRGEVFVASSRWECP